MKKRGQSPLLNTPKGLAPHPQVKEFTRLGKAGWVGTITPPPNKVVRQGIPPNKGLIGV